MPNNVKSPQTSADNYDPRWFVWTIVFLVVTGISLVSYIALSDTGTDTSAVPVSRALTHKPATK